MATFSTSNFEQILPPTAIGGGLRIFMGAFTFAGTNPTFTFVAPTPNVLECTVTGSPNVPYNGTVPDGFIVNNSRGTSGYLTSLSTTTNSANPVITITRLGTISEDAAFSLLSKG